MEEKLNAAQMDAVTSIEGFVRVIPGAGAGKTALASVIANTTKVDVKQINAAIAGKKALDELVKNV